MSDLQSQLMAKQLHDRLGKLLQSQGKNRLTRELDDLRSRYVKRRDKLAWTRLKTTGEHPVPLWSGMA